MPINMSMYGPFDKVLKLNQSNWTRLFYHFISDGVVIGSLDQMQVFGDSSGMQVKVRPGECFVNAHWGYLSEVTTVPISPAHDQYSRIDLVVARCVYDVPEQSVVCLDVLEGIPSSSPQAPTVTKTDTVWEIPLARVTVGANVATITAANITDSRPHCTLPVRMGGTGAATAAGGLTNLLAGQAVPINRGGTAATTAESARNNLGITALFSSMSSQISSILSDIAARFHAVSGHNHNGSNSRRIAITDTIGYGNAAVRNVGSATVNIASIPANGTATVAVSGLPAGALVWIEPADASWQACQIAGVRYYSHTTNSLTVKAVTNPGAITLIIGWIG